jgi:hypothetical protein
MTTKEQIAVMQGYVDGKQVQMRLCSGKWTYITRPNWNWLENEYRIKPEPREWWISQDEVAQTPQNGYYFGVARTRPNGLPAIHVREVLE